MKIAFLFPGQGSQSVGMGKELYDKYTLAQDVFDRAERLLDLPLKRLCFEGPEDELKATEVAQPAILTVSAIAYVLLSKHGIKPQLTAGHSLGEYTALFAAGVLPFHHALRLVRERGLAMAEAGRQQAGAMAAVLGLEQGKLDEVCKGVTAETGEIVVLANINAPDQLIISGTPAGVAEASVRAKAAGAKRALPLPVSGAFHSPLMAPARDRLAKALAEVTFHPAKAPVVANVDAQLTRDAQAFPAKLADQLLSPVRWTETMQLLVDEGVDTFIEVGQGTVLRNMARRLTADKTLLQVGDVKSLEEAIGAVSSLQPAAGS